jgi:hypothetical protein
MAMRSFIAFLKDLGVINVDHGNATATGGKTRAASALCGAGSPEPITRRGRPSATALFQDFWGQGAFGRQIEKDKSMSTAPATLGSSSRMKRHRERRRQGTRCVTVDVSQNERDALVVRGYLSEEEPDHGAALKKAIEGVLSDLVFDLQSETAQRVRT